MSKIPTDARYEPETRTIRSVPENYWLASMDSWDGAVDQEGTARLLAAAPRLFRALVAAKQEMWESARGQWSMADFKNWAVIQQIDAALEHADGKSRAPSSASKSQTK